MFGGPNLDVLYVTSIGGEEAKGRNRSKAGSLFAITGLGIQGVPQTRFNG